MSVTTATKASVEAGSSGESVVPRQQQLIVTLLGLYFTGPGDSIAVADLITLLGGCGVESSAVRSSVSRLKKRGLLVNQRHGRATWYAPSAKMHEVFDEGDERIFHPRRAQVGDPWLVAAFTVPEEKRHLRHRIRTIFTKWGAGSVTPGVWITPGHNRDRIVAELAHEQLTRFVDFFASEYVGEDVASKVASWWDLPTLAGMYESFVQQWEGAMDEDVSLLSPGDAFCRTLTLMTQWRRLPYLDPGLPLEVLPEPWPAQAAYELMQELHDRWTPLAQQHVDEVTGASR